MVTGILAFLFWASFALLVYVYLGYPLLLSFLASFSEPKQPDFEYPRDRLEIMVISDGSNDGTDEIVQQFCSQGVRLVRQEPRQGKTAGLNLGISEARGEILVFSDANAMYQPDAIRRLVRHFANPKVGYVVGNARYYEKGTESSSAQSEGLYWKLETYLKKKESLFASVVGGDGAIYAIRRELYSPLLPTDINDFLNPLQIVSLGYKGVFEPAAVCYEEAAENFNQEYRRKVRIISRSLNALRRVPQVLNPLNDTRQWFLLVSHKLLRWFAPFFMIACFGTSLSLWKMPFYKFAAILQMFFYLLAVFGWQWRPANKLGRILSLAFYFCTVNLASLVGCVKCFRGDISGKWAPPRQNVVSPSQQ